LIGVGVKRRAIARALQLRGMVNLGSRSPPSQINLSEQLITTRNLSSALTGAGVIVSLIGGAVFRPSASSFAAKAMSVTDTDARRLDG